MTAGELDRRYSTRSRAATAASSARLRLVTSLHEPITSIAWPCLSRINCCASLTQQEQPSFLRKRYSTEWRPCLNRLADSASVAARLSECTRLRQKSAFCRYSSGSYPSQSLIFSLT